MTTPIDPDEDPMNLAGIVLLDIPGLKREQRFDCLDVMYSSTANGLFGKEFHVALERAVEWAGGREFVNVNEVRRSLAGSNPGDYYYTRKFIIVCVA